MRQPRITRQSKLVPSRHILTEVLGWPGVHTERGRFGDTAFYVQRRELGHLHDDRIADLPLPRALCDRLVGAEAAREHRWRPDSGWVTIALNSDRAVFDVLALPRANYERGVAASDRREPQTRRAETRAKRDSVSTAPTSRMVTPQLPAAHAGRIVQMDSFVANGETGRRRDSDLLHRYGRPAALMRRRHVPRGLWAVRPMIPTAQGVVRFR